MLAIGVMVDEGSGRDLVAEDDCSIKGCGEMAAR